MCQCDITGNTHREMSGSADAEVTGCGACRSMLPAEATCVPAGVGAWSRVPAPSAGPRGRGEEPPALIHIRPVAAPSGRQAGCCQPQGRWTAAWRTAASAAPRLFPAPWGAGLPEGPPRVEVGRLGSAGRGPRVPLLHLLPGAREALARPWASEGTAQLPARSGNQVPGPLGPSSALGHAPPRSRPGEARRPAAQGGVGGQAPPDGKWSHHGSEPGPRGARVPGVMTRIRDHF